RVAQSGNVSSNLVSGDRTERASLQRLVSAEQLEPGAIVLQRLRLIGETALNIWFHFAFDELAECDLALFVADTHLAFGKRGAVRGFHLLCHSLVGLASALPDQFAVPDEPIPVDVAAFVEAHRCARSPLTFNSRNHQLAVGGGWGVSTVSTAVNRYFQAWR